MLPKLDVPIYELTLPSNGKKIKFRPFLVKEQKLFLMAAQSDDTKETIETIKQVISNCVLDDIKIDNLPMFDIEYIFLKLRAKSVGEVVELKYTCNNVIGEENKVCGGLVKFDLNLMEIEPMKNEAHVNKIQLTEKLGLVMKYPSFDSLEKIDYVNDIDLLELIISCIDYVFDDEQIYYSKDISKEELNEFIESMQQSDLMKIQKFFETVPKIKKELDFKCPKCNYHETISVEGIQNFFV